VKLDPQTGWNWSRESSWRTKIKTHRHAWNQIWNIFL